MVYCHSAVQYTLAHIPQRKQMLQPNKQFHVALPLWGLQNNTRLKVHRAIMIYYVSITTLCRRQGRVPARHDCTPISRNLTDLEEDTIFQYVLDLNSRSYPPHLRDMLKLFGVIIVSLFLPQDGCELLHLYDHTL
jgi:hypothetical protein